MFIPLYDHNFLKHVHKPIVNYSIITITVFIFTIFQSGLFPQFKQTFIVSFAVIPAVLFESRVLPDDLALIPENLTLVSYAFFHGNWLHLFGNMIFLWVFGDNVEDALGHIKYLIFYLLCAGAGGYAHALSNPFSQAPLIGASGAVAGVVAAYLILHPKTKIWILALGRIPLKLSASWVLGLWVLMQFYNIFAAAESRIAWWTHIGGLLAGAILVVLLKRRHVALFDHNIEKI